MPESMHMLMWAMSDRTLPRSFRMMEGFGVHTFRFVNAERQVDLRQVPLAPEDRRRPSLIWDESVKLYGADPDSSAAICSTRSRSGDFPEFELSVQAFDEKTADKFPFDILDATKLIPEELVPLQPVGRMVLDRNPDNFFAETEQVAFHPGHIVPGIDFTNDPLLQGRLFSYTDTQLIRLGGANFHEIPDQPAEVPDAQLPARRRAADGHHRRARSPTSRTAWRPTARARIRRRGSRRSPTLDRRRQGARALGDVRRSLQPAAAVLALDDRARAAAHRQRLRVRAEQGLDGRRSAAGCSATSRTSMPSSCARVGRRPRHGRPGRDASRRRGRRST